MGVLTLMVWYFYKMALKYLYQLLGNISSQEVTQEEVVVSVDVVVVVEDVLKLLSAVLMIEA